MQSFEVIDREFQTIVVPLCDFEKGPWAAGGSVRKVWEDTYWQDGDIDIFCNSYHQFELLSNRLTSGYPKFIRTYQTDNAVTYKNIATPSLNTGLDLLHDPERTITVQLIRKKWYTDWVEVIDNFDFSACQFITDGSVIYASDQAVADCRTRILRRPLKQYESDLVLVNPLRIIKYAAYGFKPEYELFHNAVTELVSNKGVVRGDY